MIFIAITFTISKLLFYDLQSLFEFCHLFQLCPLQQKKIQDDVVQQLSCLSSPL